MLLLFNHWPVPYNSAPDDLARRNVAANLIMSNETGRIIRFKESDTTGIIEAEVTDIDGDD